MTLGSPVEKNNSVTSNNNMFFNQTNKKDASENKSPDAGHKYYIPRPLDRYGNTLVPVSILEAQIIPQAEEQKKIHGDDIRVISPKEIAEKWSEFYTGASSLVEVPASYGPARMLTDNEHQTLWQKYLKDSGPTIEAAETEALKRSPFNY